MHIELIENAPLNARYIKYRPALSSIHEIRDLDTGAPLIPAKMRQIIGPAVARSGKAFYLGHPYSDQNLNLYELGNSIPILTNVEQDLNADRVHMVGATNHLVVWTRDLGPRPGSRARAFSIAMSVPGGPTIHANDLSGDPKAKLINGLVAIRIFEKGRWHLVGLKVDDVENNRPAHEAWIRLSDPGIEDVSEPFAVGEKILFAQKIKGRWHWKSWPGPVTENLRVLRVNETAKGTSVLFDADILEKRPRFIWDGQTTIDVTGQRSMQTTTPKEWADIIAQRYQTARMLDSYESPDGEVYQITLGRKEIIRQRDNATVSAPDVRLILSVVFTPDGRGYYIDHGTDHDRILRLGDHRDISSPTAEPRTAFRFKDLTALRDGSLSFVQAFEGGKSRIIVTGPGSTTLGYQQSAGPPMSSAVTPRSRTLVAWKKTPAGTREVYAYPSSERDDRLSDQVQSRAAAQALLQAGPMESAVLYVPASGNQHLLMTDPDQGLDRHLARLLHIAENDPAVRQTPEWKEASRTILDRIKEITENGWIPPERLIPLALLDFASTDPDLKIMDRLQAMQRLPGHHEAAQKALARHIVETFESYRNLNGELPFYLRAAQETPGGSRGSLPTSSKRSTQAACRCEPPLPAPAGWWTSTTGSHAWLNSILGLSPPFKI